MFTIDLLREKKSTAGKSISNKRDIFITASVPVISLVVVAFLLLGNSTILATQRKELAKYDQSLAKLSEAVKLQDQYDKDKESINKNLLELSSSLDKYSQWSPLLIDVVRNMPDSMIITKLDVNKNDSKRKVSKGPNQITEVRVIEKNLMLNLSGNPQYNYDKDVRDYGDRLRNSQAFKNFGLEQLSVSQNTEMQAGQEVVSYGIKCVFVTKLD